MKTINKIIAAAIIPFAIAGCTIKENDVTAELNREADKKLAYYETTIKQGDSLSRYLAQEGHPIDLDTYVLLVKMGNKDNKEAFVNYEGGQIRADKKIYLPDLDSDGRVAGKY